jgi:Ca-activated chloride channel family protein
VQTAISWKNTARRPLACGIASILISSFGLVVSGQQEAPTSGSANRMNLPPTPGVYRTNTTISVHSDLVLVPVTVTDSNGKAVSGLEKEHFTLFENDAKQEITHFAAEDVPVSIGIVFDGSDSMAGTKMHRAREAVNALVANANPDDEFMLIRFSSEARIVVPLTTRLDTIRTHVASLQVSGTTALLDGIRLALAELQQARYSRKAIVIISDGEDNSSTWTVRELKAAAREQDVLMYAIRICEGGQADYAWPSTQRSGAALLDEIARQTGGRAFDVNKLKQLPDVATRIGGYLRNQYVLGYASNDSTRDGSYRKVELKIERPRGYPRLHAVWRQGYYAPKD